jgi:hypothetical protein
LSFKSGDIGVLQGRDGARLGISYNEGCKGVGTLTTEDLRSLTTSSMVCLLARAAGSMGEAKTPLKTERPDRRDTARVENRMVISSKTSKWTRGKLSD